VARSKGTRLPGQADDKEWLTVTTPLLPEWEDLAPMLQDVLERRWLTNQGHHTQQLEAALVEALGAPHALTMCNGTLALEILLRATLEGGEVIVPAYSFPATWNLLCDDPRFTPVFVDIDDRCCLDPDAVAAAITPRTTAILGVHAYGAPCAHAQLAGLADRHGLALLYDAAHCFGVTVDGQPLGSWGTGSSWSFHATKVFNTLEGGAVTTADARIAAEVHARRNFGITKSGQTSFGTNAKLDEFRAAFGRATLPLVAAAIAARGDVARDYDEGLLGLPLTRPTWLRPQDGYVPNHAYYPIFFATPSERDRVDGALREAGILARRYFDPGLFRLPLYAGLVNAEAVPNAAAICQRVLCLPIHHQMTPADTAHVISIIRAAMGA
jgi:dTDP-4-amino-4,6-dideoxygalactose transaminase